jgi:hypothetical protein
MKVAILLGRGIEGCGVTRYALEEQKWYYNNGHECTIYAANDKKWGRKDSQQHEIVEFANNEIEALAKKLNDEMDIVYYQSLPAKKGYSDEYKELWMTHMVKGIQKPIKLSHQNDHKAQSLGRNYNIWETMSHMDACFTHSFGSPFAKKMEKENPQVPLLKMGLGFDFNSLKKYWKQDQIPRISYFGRFAGFKDPGRITEMQPQLEKYNILGEMRGIERSIGSLSLFFEDVKDRDNTYRKNIFEVNKKNPEPTIKTTDKIYIYGPYNRLEGIEELSNSMFGADFYNLDAEAYGDNMEFAMCEIIATGCIPVFDKHWAENCTHRDGRKFIDIENFAIYSDGENHEEVAKQMALLAQDRVARNKFRINSYMVAKAHCDNSIVYADMHEQAINVKKRPKNRELF